MRYNEAVDLDNVETRWKNTPAACNREIYSIQKQLQDFFLRLTKELYMNNKPFEL